MNSKLSNLFLGSIFLSISTGSAASLLLGPDLIGYSAVSGAALNISANAFVTNDVATFAAIDTGAGSRTANLYSSTGAVSTGALGSAGNIYAGAAAGVGAGATAGDIYSAAAITVAASASVENIYAAAAVTLGALSTSQDVYAAAAITGDGANSKAASTSTASEISLYKDTSDVDAALEQIVSAQEALYNLDSDFALDVGYGSAIFEAGVWGGTAVTVAANAIIQFDGRGEENPIWVFNLDAALVLGAGTKFEIINAGAGASVIWNLGGALSLGAGTSFVGAAFVTGAVTGATSDVTCGNLFTNATAAIGIGTMISTNCEATDTWSGSKNGLASGLDITDGMISNKSFSAESEAVLVSEPSTSLMMSSFALLFLAGRLKRQS
tara:strand:- start:4335 stop:5480 length:1146 start_codon:yes stop_codon:yes gene_type:complete